MNKGSLYYLIEEDGRCRQVVNGVVTSLSQKKPITYAPVGWQDILIKWSRSLTRWAQVRNYSLPMGFVRDAALILRNDMYQFNIDRKLFLLIQKLVSTIDPVYFRDRYEFLYKGELDFSSFDDVPGETRVNMNIMEGGLSKLVKANENTQYLIPFDEDAINIEMDGVRITGIYNWLLTERITGGTGYAKGAILIGQEQKAPGIAVFNVYDGMPNSIANADINADNTHYFLQVDIVPDSGVGTFTGTIKMSEPNPLFPASIFVKIYNQETNTHRATLPLYVGPEAAEIEINQDIPLLKGDRFFLEIDEFTYESNLTFSIKTRYKTTLVKAFKPIDLFKKLCIKLGIPVSKVVSTLLASCLIMVTSGDGIRGIEDPEVGVKTSLNDFIKAFDTYLMTGTFIRDKIGIESRLSFFNPANPVSLGEAADFKTSPAFDLMYSSIKVGHKEQDIEDVNGKYDFNGTHVYTTPVKKGGGKELDLTSPYKAGPYEIESIRANLDGKGTTDDSRDNQPFVIACSEGLTSFLTTVSFEAPNIMTIPFGQAVAPGQRIVILGSASNDREYIIQSVTQSIFSQTVVLDVAVTTESSVVVTITVAGGLVYSLDRSITVTAGVPDPDSIFNVPLSPKRILMAHYRWIRSWLYNYEPEELIFQQANRNSDLVAGGVIEKANVPVSSMGELVFKPYYHEFKTRVPVDLVGTLDVTPDAPFMPLWFGQEFNGFLWDAGISPNSSTPQVFKILSAPENDLTRLIV